MPRIARVSPGGIVQHVYNHGNAGMKVFRKEADYEAFIELLAEAHRRFSLKLFGYCLMPDHWHLVLYPRKEGDVSQFMRWLSNTHVRRFHQAHGSSGGGHLYQARFRSFLVQKDEHLLEVLRYVENNPVRAKLAGKAQGWRWSSLSTKVCAQGLPLLDVSPVARPHTWLKLVNQPIDHEQLKALRTSVRRGRPYGEEQWVKHIVERYSLQSTVRPRGRPRKTQK
jgi:putative transposase